MVRPLPVLRSGFRSDLAKRSSQLFTLQNTAKAGCARGLARPPEYLLWRSDMDKDTRLAILSILEVLHEAMVKARVPDDREAYASRYDNPLFELTDAENKLTHLVAAGIQAVGENCGL
jgi:hypothetical protein